MTTEKTEAEAVDMQAMMTAAAQGEVIEPEELEQAVEEPEEQEAIEEPEEPEAVEEPEEPPEPKDNAARSKLGRKVEAMWERLDTQNETFEKLAKVLEAMTAKEAAQDEDDDVFISRAQAEELAAKKVQEVLAAKDESQTKYEKRYRDELLTVGEEYEPDEFDSIQKIMMEKYNIKHTGNPEYDALRNWRNAEKEFLQSAKKAVPKGKLPTGAKIATTGTEKVKEKKKILPKLDAAAQRYLDMITRTRGPEAAQRVREMP